MAAQIPVKAIYSGSDVTSLGEFTASDDITITYLPTGTSSSTVALGDHTHAYLPLAGGTLTGNLITTALIDGRDVAADGVLAAAAMPKSGGAFTGAITTNSTIDTVDIATRDGVLTTTTATAAAALPKAGGTMTAKLTIDQNTDNAGLDIDCEATSEYGIRVTGKSVLRAEQDISGGRGAYITRNIAEAGSNPLVQIIDDHTSNTQPALGIQQDGAGYGISIDQNGNKEALFIDSESTTYTVMQVEADALTGGSAAYFYSNSADTTSRKLFQIINDHASATGTTSLYVKNDSTGLAADFQGKVAISKSVTTGTDTDTSNTGSITLDFAANQNFVLTLTGNVTLANPTTEQVGQSGFIAFIQDGTGSRTVALGTDYETAAAAGLTLTATASATDLVPYLVVASGRILLGTPQLAFA